MPSIKSQEKYSIREFMLQDYEEVVRMYKELTKEIYPMRKIGEDYFFYRSVIGWVQAGKHIIVAHKGDEIVGFSLCYIEELGTTEPVYFGECAYVKPKHRKTKASYLLYKNGSDKASELGLALHSNAYIGGNNKVDKIQSKFNLVPMFVGMERKA